MRQTILRGKLSILLAPALLSAAWADAPAGLKQGDRLPVFPVTALTGPYAGKTLAYGSALQGAPTVIVFVRTLDADNIKVLGAVDHALKQQTGAGLKGFAVSVLGNAAAVELKGLAEKNKWTVPLAVTRGTATDPACTLCKLDPKSKNTVLVAVKNEVKYARQNLAAADLAGLTAALAAAVQK